ncbi:MAG: hypothetical protein HQK96_01640 [Nitrospirae bacterium]|nr:hypothetical protein [Nitrospirota bacterium]
MEPCPRCGAGKDKDRYASHFEVIERNAEAPMKMSGGLCPKCDKMRKDADLEVSKGGIYWKCDKCGSTGAVKATSELSKNIRKKMKIEPPNPCGVVLLPEQCPVCQKEKV